MDRPGTLVVSVATSPPSADPRFSVELGAGSWSAPGPGPDLLVPIPTAGTRIVRLAAFSGSGAWRSDTLALAVHAAPAPATGAGELPLAPVLIGGVAGLLVAGAGFTIRGRGRIRPSAPPSSAGARAGSGSGNARDARQLLDQEANELRSRLREIQNGMREVTRLNQDLEEKCRSLEASNAELRDLQRRKEEVLAGIAHDIKNPAAAIQSLAELLQSFSLSAQDQQQFVSDILQTSTRVVRLSQELSNVLVMEVRGVPLSLAVAPIRPLIEQVCRTNQILADKKTITIRTILPNELPGVEMDAHKIEQVLDNLVGNAVKYSRPYTSVKVEARASATHVTIDVIDTGPGLSESDLQNAFQIGRTLSAKPTGGEASTGVGLWVVRKMVEAHRGTVTVRSTSGAGSTFSVQIPVTQE